VFPDFRDAHVENLIDTLGVLSKLDDVDIVVPGAHGADHTAELSLYERLE